MNEFLLQINWVDAGIVLILITSGLFAYFRGFIQEVFSLGSWLLAIYLSITQFEKLLPYVLNYVTTPILASIITGTTIFILTLTLSYLIGSWIITKVFKDNQSQLNQLLGFFYGVFRGGFLISALYLIFYQYLEDTPMPEMVQKARLIAPTSELAISLAQVVNEIAPSHISIPIPPQIKDMVMPEITAEPPPQESSS